MKKSLGKKLSGFFEKKPRQKTLVGCAANSGAGSGTFTGRAANSGAAWWSVKMKDKKETAYVL
ncbi:hypothetical protein NSA36_06625 [Anaerotruncus colihominis]|nr:hypothetical protein [Anaerotruncus colihominis]